MTAHLSFTAANPGWVTWYVMRGGHPGVAGTFYWQTYGASHYSTPWYGGIVQYYILNSSDRQYNTVSNLYITCSF